jgi:hypothetical protein
MAVSAGRGGAHCRPAGVGALAQKFSEPFAAAHLHVVIQQQQIFAGGVLATKVVDAGKVEALFRVGDHPQTVVALLRLFIVGKGGGAKAGGISIIGLIVAFVAWKFFGVDPQQAYQATQAVTSAQSSQQGVAPQNLTAEQKEASDFVGTILADTEDTWTPIFQKLGMTYTPPRLVLFSGVDKSACGRAQAAMGPFYCPADQKVYIDTAFFKDILIDFFFLVLIINSFIFFYSIYLFFDNKVFKNQQGYKLNLKKNDLKF